MKQLQYAEQFIKYPHHYLNINGIDFYYEFYPHQYSRKTILLIHGFLSSTFSFRYLIPKLTDQFQVISVDLPPFGKSGKSFSFCYSYENIARSLIELLNHLKIKESIIVAHSMGGQIGLNMIVQEPSRFTQAVLLASSGYLKRARQPLIAVSYIPFFHLFVKNRLARTGVLGNLEQVVYSPDRITEEMVQGYLEPFIQSDEIFRGLTKLLRDREGDLSSDILQRIETPCLLIWGDHDKVVPLSVGERLQRDLKYAELKVFDKTGHLIPEERPEETAHLIKSFVH